MKLERLMAITILLLNRKRVQAQELAERLEVSLRTIYRDLESLNVAGIPIVSYTGAEGGFEIMDSFRMDRQMLSFDELIALFTALRGLHSTQAFGNRNLEGLLDKVGALVSKAEQGRMAGSEQVMIDLNPWRNSSSERNKVDTLHKAVNDERVIRFTYTDGQGGETERCIEPMGMVLKGYTWYLHGYCLNRDAYRMFRLSRIRDLLILEDTFERRSATLSELNENLSPQRTSKMIDLVLRIKGPAKVAAEDHFDEDEIERQPDGSLIVRVRYPDNEWLIGFLLGFKADLFIIEPLHIAAAVRQTALEISELYMDC
ncbi:helix-turn-helix transcriptional regulator [Paenibacillus nasutitermitis]|uniref:DeoR family transcriptional regulator n=1 Tax=Paenibacillus nasutitermitis TaxID=1652958 RepID=A0A916ZHP7_9BACL|nr:YafY family protein [Paenibacillus nasutitermitis]GGD97242.1 DeoR family transcriptional regulator [Paenibacillus nasutitermitis]